MILNDLFETIEMLKAKVFSLEKEVKVLRKSHEFETLLTKSNFTRIKGQQKLSHLMINGEITYYDLSPQAAITIYRDQDKDYLILDITEESDRADIKLEGVQYIPYSHLKEKMNEIKNTSAPILVISKKGLKSILACEILARNGFLNVNNVSGGYLLWGKSEDNQFKRAA